jgi:hypothetical protein
MPLLYPQIFKIWRPAAYQGKRWMTGYFEGWYYKLADRKGENVCALIPGVSFDKEGKKPHSFIQFLESGNPAGRVFTHGFGNFAWNYSASEANVAGSIFSPEGIRICASGEAGSIKGALAFKGITPWPVRPLSPGAMGWYAFVPFMECYHAVLSFDHEITGSLEINGRRVDFTGGRGYIEKDWGRSFPSYHVWLQTNHFEAPGTSLMASVASVPWLGRAFNGFLAGFLHRGRLYCFATWSGAKISLFRYAGDVLSLHLRSRAHALEIEAPYSKGAELLAPSGGEMSGRLSESLSAEIRVRLYRLRGKARELVFEGTGRHAGLEIAGRLPQELP